jgi:hypothetical protein
MENSVAFNANPDGSGGSHQNLEQQFATLIWELGLVY